MNLEQYMSIGNHPDPIYSVTFTCDEYSYSIQVLGLAAVLDILSKYSEAINITIKHLQSEN